VLWIGLCVNWFKAKACYLLILIELFHHNFFKSSVFQCARAFLKTTLSILSKNGIHDLRGHKNSSVLRQLLALNVFPLFRDYEWLEWSNTYCTSKKSNTSCMMWMKKSRVYYSNINWTWFVCFPHNCRILRKTCEVFCDDELETLYKWWSNMSCCLIIPVAGLHSHFLWPFIL